MVTAAKNSTSHNSPHHSALTSRKTLIQSHPYRSNSTGRWNRARYYHAELGRFISRDPIGYVDGMSLYRAYFIPNYVDPLGKQVQIINITPWILHFIIPTRVLFEACVDRCIHHFMVFHRETYLNDLASVEAECQKWCRKRVRPKPPFELPAVPPPKGWTLKKCTPWFKTGQPTWGQWKEIERDGCVCKYEAIGEQKWARNCQLRTWDITTFAMEPAGDIETETRSTQVRKIKEEYCD